MGKKRSRKASKRARKILLAHLKKNKRKIQKKGYKDTCCLSYKNPDKKRCKRCPCYDLLKEVA